MTGVVTAIRIVKRVSQIAAKYKYLDINQKFVRKYVPPGYRKQAEFVLDTAIGGGLLYQIVDGIYYAFQKPRTRPSPYSGQTRSPMEFPGKRQFFGKQRYPRYCRPAKRKKYSY